VLSVLHIRPLTYTYATHPRALLLTLSHHKTFLIFLLSLPLCYLPSQIPAVFQLLLFPCVIKLMEVTTCSGGLKSNKIKAISTQGQFAKEKVAPNLELVWNTDILVSSVQKWKKEEESLFKTKQHFKKNAPCLFFPFCVKLLFILPKFTIHT